MYQIDEFVIHMTGGICQVKDIAPVELPGADKSKNYYLLVPIKAAGGKVYVPVDNDMAMRKIYTEEEAKALLDDVPNIPEAVIENEKFREATYKEVIKSCDLRNMVAVLKNLRSRRIKRTLEGKKNTATDDKYLKIVEDNLSSELAFALGKEKVEIKEEILKLISE